MSLETILLIGVLTTGAIALGADCLWNLVIKSSLNSGNLTKETGFAEYLSKIVIDVQRQADRFLIVILLVVLASAIILNIIPHSRLEPYLLKIGLIGLIVVLSLISVEYAIGNQNTSDKAIITNVFIGIRLITEVVVYWSFLHYAINPKI